MPVSNEVKNFIDKLDDECGNTAEVRNNTQKEILNKSGPALTCFPHTVGTGVAVLISLTTTSSVIHQ